MAGTQTTTNTETSSSSGSTTHLIPKFVENAGEGLINRIITQMDTPAPKYAGTRVSDLSTDEKTGIQGVRDAQGNWKPNLQATEGMIQNAAGQHMAVDPAAMAAYADKITTGTWDGAAADKYMNPYLERVLKAKTARLATERDTALRNGALTAAKSGNFGGARHGIADAGTQGAFATSLEESQATGYNDAWDKAMTAYGGDQDRALGAGKANADNYIRIATANQDAINTQSGRKLDQFNAEQNRTMDGAKLSLDAGKAKSDLANNDASNLVKAGVLQRDVDQSKNDAAYEEWQDGNNKFYKDANLLGATLGAIPISTTTNTTGTGTSSGTQTGPKQGGGLFSKVLGTAAVGASFF